MRKIKTSRDIVIKHGEGDDAITLTYRFPFSHEKDYDKVRAMLQIPTDPEEAKAYTVPDVLGRKLFNEELIESLIAVEGFETEDGQVPELTRLQKEIFFNEFSSDEELFNKIITAKNGSTGKN